MKHAQINGATITYDTEGSGEAVLLLHCGLVGESSYPLMHQPALTTRYQLIHYNRRGYGASDSVQPPFSMEAQAADALALLDTLGIEQAHLAGHSLGAIVALEVARRAPARVATLTLLEPPLVFALSPQSGQFMGSAIGQAVHSFMKGEVERAVNEWLDPAFGPGWQEICNRALPGGYTQVVHDGPAALSVEAAALQSWDFGPDDLSKIQQPTLAIYHRDSRFTLFDEVQAKLVASIPHVESVEIAVGSHLLQIEDPQAVAEALASFLQRHSLTTSGRAQHL